MPLYTYLCKKCFKEFDFLVGVSQEKEELKCPFCGSKNLEKILAAFRISGSNKGSSCSSCSGGNCSTCRL